MYTKKKIYKFKKKRFKRRKSNKKKQKQKQKGGVDIDNFKNLIEKLNEESEWEKLQKKKEQNTLNIPKELFPQSNQLFKMINSSSKSPSLNLLDLQDSTQNIQNTQNENLNSDPINMLIIAVINKIKSDNTKNSTNITCGDVIDFLKDFKKAKDLFTDITKPELDSMILALQNHHFCVSN